MPTMTVMNTYRVRPDEGRRNLDLLQAFSRNSPPPTRTASAIRRSSSTARSASCTS